VIDGVGDGEQAERAVRVDVDRSRICGDWCLDARVEAAFLSGDALGTALVESQRIARSGKMHGSQ